MNLEVYFQLAEDALKEIGVAPETVRKSIGQWALQKGSANIDLIIWYDKKNQSAYIQVSATVVKAPEQNKEAFYSEILDINAKIFGVGMVKIDPWIIMRHVREVEDIDVGELVRTIHRVATYTDIYDDYLKKKYWGAA